jgi:hypothetical protein
MAFNRFKCKNEELVAVRGGKRLFVQATSSRYGPGVPNYPSNVAIEAHYCTRVVSFLPEPGAAYVLFQDEETAACPVALTEVKTGRAPETYLEHSVSAGCRFVK